LTASCTSASTPAFIQACSVNHDEPGLGDGMLYGRGATDMKCSIATLRSIYRQALERLLLPA
jgi:hypothetical protein